MTIYSEEGDKGETKRRGKKKTARKSKSKAVINHKAFDRCMQGAVEREREKTQGLYGAMDEALKKSAEAKKQPISMRFLLGDRMIHLLPLPSKIGGTMEVSEVIKFGRKHKAMMGAKMAGDLGDNKNDIPVEYQTDVTFVFPKYAPGRIMTIHWSEFGHYWMAKVQSANFDLKVDGQYLICNG